jgi:hypothetical protein
MLVTIHQPEHLPWLGFIDKASRADLFVLLDDVPFRKNYFQNRNRIRSAEGVEWVTVPVLLKGRSGDEIRNIEINNEGSPRWRQKCWLTIEQRYSTAPFWRSHAGALREIYQDDWRLLADLNIALIRALFTSFGIAAPVVRSSELGVNGEKGERLLQICRKVGATRYLSGISGPEYLDPATFQRAGVEVIFQEFHHPIYRQLHEPFIPLLSSIDLLFNHGEDSRRILAGDGVPTMTEVFH